MKVLAVIEHILLVLFMTLGAPFFVVLFFVTGGVFWLFLIMGVFLLIILALHVVAVLQQYRNKKHVIIFESLIPVLNGLLFGMLRP